LFNNPLMTISASKNQDKTGDALKAQRFQMLEDIAKELAGEVVFPTYFDAVLRLRRILQDPNASMNEIAHAVSIEPLISAKLLQLANSVAFNPSGRELLDLKSAVIRLGMNAVRTAALSIVMAQLMRAKGMAAFSEITHALWDHSIHTAAAARILAQEVPRLNADEAMLAGLVHDLGAFYMLYRASLYDELRQRPESVHYLIVQWHESIGVSLLGALGLPEEIVNATIDHDNHRPVPTVFKNLSEVLFVANLLSGGHQTWSKLNHAETPPELPTIEERFGHLRPQIYALAIEMGNSLA